MDNLLIGDFEGPLDLLLHLIKKSKMEIFDIEISEITKEYLNYIKEMTDMNLDIASEYLVMAAELIEMKSRKLLPNKKMKAARGFRPAHIPVSPSVAPPLPLRRKNPIFM